MKARRPSAGRESRRKPAAPGHAKRPGKGKSKDNGVGGLKVVVLAAGVGSRMRSRVPKVLHRVGGRPLIHAVLDTAARLEPERVVVVLGAARAAVEEALSRRPVTIAVQDPPRGTGDAVRRALPALGEGDGPVVVLSGDAPLLRSETVAALIALRRAKSLDLAFLSFSPPEPGAFGRVVRDGQGRVRRIVEARNAGRGDAKIREVNAGVYCFSRDGLDRALESLSKDAKSGELYLTDAVEVLARRGGKVEAVEAEDWREAWGINTRAELAAAEEMTRRRSLEHALDSGVTVLDPATARIGPLVSIAPDAVIHPFVCLEGSTVVGEGCEILPFTRIVDSTIDAGAVVGSHADLEGATVGARARVGPFARLRPGTVLGEDVRVGNFVETKNARLGRNAKASHLSYLGDAEIGADVNIGAGVITCNYDGMNKNRTEIGEGAFVGSDSQLVAPVTVGAGAYVGAGSTITKDVPPGALAITRAPQRNLEGWAEKRAARRPTGKRH